MDEYLGVVKLFAFSFTPRGWLPCDGRLLSISQNQALFSLLGTTYGGDGRVNFALPNLNGKTALGMSNLHPIGQTAGAETVTLTTSQLPAHSHPITVSNTTVTGTVNVTASLKASSATASSETPTAGSVLSKVVESGLGAIVHTYGTGTQDVTMGGLNVAATPSLQANVSATIGNTGLNQPVSTMPPFLSLNYCICVEGIFPSRAD